MGKYALRMCGFFENTTLLGIVVLWDTVSSAVSSAHVRSFHPKRTVNLQVKCKYVVTWSP